MDINDIKVGMTIRVKTSFELDVYKHGKNKVLFAPAMRQCMGKEYVIIYVTAWKGGVQLETHGLTPAWYLWDIDWLEELEPYNINIHSIHYKE